MVKMKEENLNIFLNTYLLSTVQNVTNNVDSFVDVLDIMVKLKNNNEIVMEIFKEFSKLGNLNIETVLDELEVDRLELIKHANCESVQVSMIESILNTGNSKYIIPNEKVKIRYKVKFKEKDKVTDDLITKCENIVTKEIVDEMLKHLVDYIDIYQYDLSGMYYKLNTGYFSTELDKLLKAYKCNENIDKSKVLNIFFKLNSISIIQVMNTMGNEVKRDDLFNYVRGGVTWENYCKGYLSEEYLLQVLNNALEYISSDYAERLKSRLVK